MQSQNSSPFQESLGATYIEENTSHTPEIPEMISTKIKKQVQEAMKELKSEIISQVKEEMIKVVKEIVNASKEDTAKKKRGTKQKHRTLE